MFKGLRKYSDDMLRDQKSLKQLGTYGIVGAGALFLVFSTMLISDPTSITFRSDADEGRKHISISRRASSSVELAQNDLPSCVKRLSYIPEQSINSHSCLVSVECVDTISEIPNDCSLIANTVSCYKQAECVSLGDWVVEASKVCKC